MNIIYDNGMYFIWFGICFIGYAIRTAFNVLAYRKHPWAENKKIVTLVFIVMGILWFSWFSMCFNDPVKMIIPVWLRYLGLLFFLIGFFLFVISHRKMKGFEDKGGLVTSGIYSKIRNPMYLGFMIWIVGFPVFTRSLISLASSPIWIAFIFFWKILEEKDLERKYVEYKAYKRKTWF